MKVIVFCSLILGLLGSVALSWNDNPSYRLLPEAGPPYTWAKCKVSDYDGTLTAYAEITVDIDYILEPRLPGIEYFAYARVSGTSSPEHEGTWNCYA